MTDTHFMIGWYSPFSDPTSEKIWTKIRGTIERLPHTIPQWLESEKVDHSYGFYVIPNVTTGLRTQMIKIITIHDPDHAVAFRIQFDARPLNLNTMIRTMDREQLLEKMAFQ